MTETAVLNFEDSLKNLHAVVNNIGRKTESHFTEKIPRFVTSCAKFMNCFNKIKDDPVAVGNMKERFNNVFYNNKDEIVDNIFDETGSISDDWIRNAETEDESKNSKKKKSHRISLNDVRYKGISIYIDETNIALSNICIPIHEIYMETDKIYKHLLKNKEVCYLPFNFLHAIYFCFYFSLPEEKYRHKESVMRNITRLSEFISSGASEETESTGTVFDGLSNMIKKFTSGNNVNTNRISSLIDGVIAPENKERVSQAYNLVSKKVQEKGDFFEGLKESFQSPEVTSLVSQGRELYNTASSFLSNANGEKSTSSEAHSNIAADEQE